MDYSKYKNNDDYPAKPTRPYLEDKATPDEIRIYADLMEKYNKDMIEYLNKKKEWDEKKSILMSQFKHDVLKENGILGHPKADKLYNIAWEHGHSAGVKEVSYWVQDLVELIRD